MQMLFACALNGDTLMEAIKMFGSDFDEADELVCGTFDVDMEWLQTYRGLMAERLIDLCVQEARKAVDIEAAFSPVEEGNGKKGNTH